MKNFRPVKKTIHFISSGLSRLPTSAFSTFFIKWGYFIRSEAYLSRLSVKNFKTRREMHNFLSSEYLANEKILYLEFGVFKGHTFFLWAKNNQNKGSLFYGFDTFTGIPEAWGRRAKGSFSAEGKIPENPDSRCTFVKGLIENTLTGYLEAFKTDKRKVIHIDVDIYSATLYTLVVLNPLLKKGDIIIFDDFFTTVVADHEFKALQDYLAAFKIDYKPLVVSNRAQYVIEIN